MPYYITNNGTIRNTSGYDLPHGTPIHYTRIAAQIALTELLNERPASALQAIRDSQTDPTVVSTNPVPPTPLAGPTPSPVEVNMNQVADKNGFGNKFAVTFSMDMDKFSTMLSPKLIQDTFATQSKVFLAQAVAEMVSEESFKEMIKPKVREHLMSMSLNDIMMATDLDLGGIIDLLR